MTTNPRKPAQSVGLTRRKWMHAGATTALGVLGASIGCAQSTPKSPKVRIGYWPIAAGLPFYSAIERGYFKDVGLDVEAIKFAGPQQVMEAVLSGRADGTANGTGSANIAIGEIAQPGTFKIFCSNPSNAENILDEVIVPIGSSAQVMADLQGKRVGSGPGIQNVTLAKTVLERGGAIDATVVELPIGQHVAALAAGQIDGAYTLEPTGTIGRLNGTSRVLEAGVIGRYVLGDPLAPWFGGSASFSSDFIRTHPEAARKFISAYKQGVNFVRTDSVGARKYLQGYTPIDGPLAGEVPLAAYTMYDEFTSDDVAHFQKFFDLFSEKGVFRSRLVVDSMLYKG